MRRSMAGPGSDDEFLVGDLELAYTTEKNYDGVRHFLISFNEKVKKPVDKGLSSANAPRLTDEEILEMINNAPTEETL